MAGTSHTSSADWFSQLEQYVLDGDLPAMMQAIAQLHEQWDKLDMDKQDHVRRLEAVFLSMLKAKAEAEAHS